MQFNNPLDQFLHQRGKKRRVAARSGHLSTLVHLMNSTPAILVSTHHLNHLFADKHQLCQVYEIKNEPDIQVDYFLIEHQRTVDSAAHQWMKALILETLKKEFSLPHHEGSK